MKSHITFPADLIDFLVWVKTTTESAWSNVPPESAIHGAKWLGLSDQEIDGLEQKYDIKFGYEHRAFLKVLHTIDKNYDEPEYDKDDEEDSPMAAWGTPSFFYNWLTDTNWIENKLEWRYETILFDVLNTGFWLKSWGQRPDTREEKTRIFSAWYHNAPRLLPVKAHTFLMDDAGHGLKPLLSVYGTDTIVIAWSLRHYLMRTFAKELELEEMVFDEEGQYYYDRIVSGIPELDDWETIRLDDADIPYWKGIITYWKCSSPWQGFRV
ncbi:hypothetical protein [Chitinophaga sp. HK235]|uniref:hypothetical protein n=1 Tax=Chitinophaga sp. HK235 TaxID=2952571 RepID=UPI001BAAA1D5|nr:hypothetical protein [Chitinophaga sp. HK235]